MGKVRGEVFDAVGSSGPFPVGGIPFGNGIGLSTDVSNLFFTDATNTLGLGGDVVFKKEVNHTISVADSTTIATPGALLNIFGGAGSPADAVQPGRRGTDLTIRSGHGGAGSAAQIAGIGGDTIITAGDAGANGGAGGNDGGDVIIMCGAPTGAGVRGGIDVGNSNTFGILLGKAPSFTGDIEGHVRFEGRIQLDLHFLESLGHTIDIDKIATAAAAGQALTITGGEAGNATGAAAGGKGGSMIVRGALGGAGSATFAAGAGGDSFLNGGAAGAAAAAGGAFGGSTNIDAGAGSGAFVAGAVNIGTQQGAGRTSQVNICSAAITLGFFAVAPVVRQVSGANLTNNVTAGGVNDTIADYADLVVYANDAAAIRNDIYQLARKLKQVNDGLRLYGLLT